MQRGISRNELCIKYNRGVNIIDVIDNCLGVTAIGLGTTGVSLLSISVAAPAKVKLIRKPTKAGNGSTYSNQFGKKRICIQEAV